MNDKNDAILSLSLNTDLQRARIVTETFIPEINGRAQALSERVDDLCQRGIAVQVIRSKQHGRNDGHGQRLGCHIRWPAVVDDDFIRALGIGHDRPAVGSMNKRSLYHGKNQHSL